jgi:hypothetical protein
VRRVYISCTNRVESPEDSPQDRGDAYVIDWDTKKVINRLDVYGPEDIKVGRSRGCAGIAWYNNKIYIACRSGLCVIDPDTLELVDEISDVGTGIHEIKVRDDKLYITNTSTDSFTVLQDNEIVDRVYIKEKDLPERVIRHLNVPGRKADVEFGADKLHFNSLAWGVNGDMYHLYMAGGIVYNWTRKQLACGILGEAMHHDIASLDKDTLLINGSDIGETILIDIPTKSHRTVRKNNVGALNGAARHGWLRGMAVHKQTKTLFLTTAPGQLIIVDTNTWKDLDSMKFSTQPKEAPYGILLDPRDWKNEDTTKWLTELGKIGQ